jgi:hypothetical protein
VKPFSQQYRECRQAKLTGVGPIKKFKDHPDLLPVRPLRAVKIIAEALKKDPDFGFPFVTCLRFGGECNSGKPECRKLRQESLDK